MKRYLLVFSLFLNGASFSVAQEWNVPDEEKRRVNPIEATPEAIEEGAEHFRKQCVMCHGEALKGDGPAAPMFSAKPPDLSSSEARSRLTDGEIFFKMTVGKNPMPAMTAKLSEEERWKIVLYFRTLQDH